MSLSLDLSDNSLCLGQVKYFQQKRYETRWSPSQEHTMSISPFNLLISFQLSASRKVTVFFPVLLISHLWEIFWGHVDIPFPIRLSELLFWARGQLLSKMEHWWSVLPWWRAWILIFMISCGEPLWLMTRGGVGELEPCGPGALPSCSSTSETVGTGEEPRCKVEAGREQAQGYTVGGPQAHKGRGFHLPLSSYALHPFLLSMYETLSSLGVSAEAHIWPRVTVRALFRPLTGELLS